MYKLECSQCKKEIILNKLRYFKRRNKINICETCEIENKRKLNYFERKCSSCNKILFYKNEHQRNHSDKYKKNCHSCKSIGKKNHFYGKHHSEKTKLKISKNNIGRKHSNETKKKIGQKSKNNGCGGNIYDIWKKQGLTQEEINIKTKTRNKKLSEAFSGKNNPMYGKSAPNGSGNGWKGWYKGWFFRSLRELSYMIDVIEKNNYKWLPGEQFCRINYIDHLGRERTYKPDFLINDRIIIEIKPKRLWGTPNILCKVKTAIKFAKEKDLKYKIIDIDIIKKSIIQDKINSGELIFSGDYLKRFKNYGK